MTSPMLVTRDQTMIDEVLRLAAAAGVAVEHTGEPQQALRHWHGAALVLVGADLAGPVTQLQPQRRAGAYLVAWEPPQTELLQWAVDLGAEAVVDLARSAEWLTETLTDLGDDRRPDATMWGVVGACGGAGATTLACAMGQVAALAGDTVVIDCDPLGPGADLVLGLEQKEGFRWDALCQTTGRISARSLREALPRRDRLGVLSWTAGRPGAMPPFAVREALSAARRGHDTVVLDLPRSAGKLGDELVSRCDRLLVVVSPTVTGVAAAARACSRLDDVTGAGLVVRGTGVEPSEITAATGLPVLLSMTDQRGVRESIDLGLGPLRSRRGRLFRAAAALLALADAPTAVAA